MPGQSIRLGGHGPWNQLLRVRPYTSFAMVSRADQNFSRRQFPINGPDTYSFRSRSDSFAGNVASSSLDKRWQLVSQRLADNLTHLHRRNGISSSRSRCVQLAA